MDDDDRYSSLIVSRTLLEFEEWLVQVWNPWFIQVLPPFLPWFSDYPSTSPVGSNMSGAPRMKTDNQSRTTEKNRG